MWCVPFLLGYNTNLGLVNAEAVMVLVSQFTLLARTKKGTKPDFHGAMNPDEASRLYHYFVSKVETGYTKEKVKQGKFQTMMEVALVNDGPVSSQVGDHGDSLAIKSLLS